MKRVPLSIRIAAAVTVAALAACGGGGESSTASSGTASANKAPATTDGSTASSPAAAAAPAPAPASTGSTNPDVTTTTAPTGPVGDPVVGKQLFDALPGGQPSCLACHTVADVRAKARTEEGYRFLTWRAVNGNVGTPPTPYNSTMSTAMRGLISDQQIQNIAAFLKWGS